MTNPLLLPLTYPEALCVDDFDSFDRTVGSDFEALEQDCYHWLLQEKRNPDEERPENANGAQHGVGLEDILSAAVVDVQAVGPRISEDFLQDDRITACNATVSLQTDGSYLIEIEIEVGAATLGLQYSYDATNGLRTLSSP